GSASRRGRGPRLPCWPAGRRRGRPPAARRPAGRPPLWRPGGGRVSACWVLLLGRERARARPPVYPAAGRWDRGPCGRRGPAWRPPRGGRQTTSFCWRFARRPGRLPTPGCNPVLSEDIMSDADDDLDQPRKKGKGKPKVNAEARAMSYGIGVVLFLFGIG